VRGTRSRPGVAGTLTRGFFPIPRVPIVHPALPRGALPHKNANAPDFSGRRTTAPILKDIVNNRVAIDYILDLTSGVTSRIVELVRLSARCAVRCDSRTVTVDLVQEAGKEFASDLGSERNVSH
jgi:hypothetical protein